MFPTCSALPPKIGGSNVKWFTVTRFISLYSDLDILSDQNTASRFGCFRETAKSNYQFHRICLSVRPSRLEQCFSTAAR